MPKFGYYADETCPHSESILLTFFHYIWWFLKRGLLIVGSLYALTVLTSPLTTAIAVALVIGVWLWNKHGDAIPGGVKVLAIAVAITLPLVALGCVVVWLFKNYGYSVVLVGACITVLCLLMSIFGQTPQPKEPGEI